jgi:hypothetical protein
VGSPAGVFIGVGGGSDEGVGVSIGVSVFDALSSVLIAFCIEAFNGVTTFAARSGAGGVVSGDSSSSLPSTESVRGGLLPAPDEPLLSSSSGVVGSEIDFFSSGEDSEGAGEDVPDVLLGPPPPPELGLSCVALESLPPAPEEVFCSFEGFAFFGSEEAPFDEVVGDEVARSPFPESSSGAPELFASLES